MLRNRRILLTAASMLIFATSGFAEHCRRGGDYDRQGYNGGYYDRGQYRNSYPVQYGNSYYGNSYGNYNNYGNYGNYGYNGDGYYQPQRSTAARVGIIGGSAAAGAAIGALAGGGKGAAIGAAIGGLGGYLYDRQTRNRQPVYNDPYYNGGYGYRPYRR